MAMSEIPFLEAANLNKSYAATSIWPVRRKRHEVLHNISLTVSSGRTIGVVGESGSGKSTLCRLLLHLEDPTSGIVRYMGQDVRTLNEETKHAYRRSVQAVFQDPLSSLNPRMRIASILEEPFHAAMLGLDKVERRDRVTRLMSIVGLDGSLAQRYPSQLSGGQRQRVAIARAIALDPKLIVADEPITALDVSVQAQIINLFRDLQEQRGISYLFVSHDLNMVRFLCHDVLVLLKGRIVERGAVHDVFHTPRHPYTKLLLSATLSPDPDISFKKPVDLTDARTELYAGAEVQISDNHWALLPDSDGRGAA